MQRTEELPIFVDSYHRRDYRLCTDSINIDTRGKREKMRYWMLEVIDFCNLFVTIDYNEAANGRGLFNKTNQGWSERRNL
jgi:hypothetical protein